MKHNLKLGWCAYYRCKLSEEACRRYAAYNQQNAWRPDACQNCEGVIMEEQIKTTEKTIENKRPENVRPPLNEAIRALRLAANENMKDVATACNGLNASSISRWEQGNSKPSREKLKILDNHWGSNLVEVYGNEVPEFSLTGWAAVHGKKKNQVAKAAETKIETPKDTAIKCLTNAFKNLNPAFLGPVENEEATEELEEAPAPATENEKVKVTPAQPTIGIQAISVTYLALSILNKCLDIETVD